LDSEFLPGYTQIIMVATQLPSSLIVSHNISPVYAAVVRAGHYGGGSRWELRLVLQGLASGYRYTNPVAKAGAVRTVALTSGSSVPPKWLESVAAEINSHETIVYADAVAIVKANQYGLRNCLV
jgi:hypothetical protein